MTYLMYLFIFAACFSAWIPLSLDVAGLHLRLSVAMLPFVLAATFLSRPTTLVSRLGLGFFVAGATLAAAFLCWTLANIDAYAAPLTPVAHVVLLCLNLLHAVAIWWLVACTGRWRQAIMTLLLSIAALNGVLLVAAIARAIGLSLPLGLIAEEDGPVIADGDAVFGAVLRFKFAGVIAGVMSAAGLIIVAALCLRARRDRQSPLLASIGILMIVGIVLGFSRQAIISLAAGLALLGACLVLQGRFTGLLRVVVALSIVAAVGLGVTMSVPGGQGFFQGFAGRVFQIVDTQSYSSGTIAARTALWSGMWSDIVHDPLRGLGQDAYLKHMVNPDESGSHNFPLEILHAAGLIGFFPYLLMHGRAMWLAWATLRRHRSSETDRCYLLGLLCGFVAIWVSSLSNLIASAGVYWLFFGLLAGGVHHVRVIASRRCDALV